MCASGTRISSCPRPVSRSVPAGSRARSGRAQRPAGRRPRPGSQRLPCAIPAPESRPPRQARAARRRRRRGWRRGGRAIESASFLRGHFTRRAYSRTVAATLMDGKALAARIREEVAAEVAAFPRPIGLATVLVGDDPASDVYIRSKHGSTLEVGIEARDLRLPASTSEGELLALVQELNANDAIDAILVQLPLPDQIDQGRIIRAVARSRTWTGSTRSTPACSSPARPGTSRGRRWGSSSCSTSTTSRCRARTRSWSAAATSSASRWRSSCCTGTRP